MLNDKEKVVRLFNDFWREIEELKEEIYFLKNPDKIGTPSRPEFDERLE